MDKDDLIETHAFFTSTPKKAIDSSHTNVPNESNLGLVHPIFRTASCTLLGGDIYWFDEAGDSSEQLLPGNVELT